jgi:hypothetical protein
MNGKLENNARIQAYPADDLEEGGLGRLLRDTLHIKDPVEVIVLTRDERDSRVFAAEAATITPDKFAQEELVLERVESISTVIATPASISLCTRYCLRYIGGRWVYVCCAWS